MTIPADNREEIVTTGEERASSETIGSEALKKFEKELTDLERLAYIEAKNRWKAGRNWDILNNTLALPAAVVAAIAGGTGLSSASLRVPAAFLALASASLAAILATLSPAARSSQAKSQSDDLWALCHDTRLFRDFDLPHTGYEQARSKLSELWLRFSNLTRSSPSDEGSEPRGK